MPATFEGLWRNADAAASRSARGAPRALPGSGFAARRTARRCAARWLRWLPGWASMASRLASMARRLASMARRFTSMASRLASNCRFASSMRRLVSSMRCPISVTINVTTNATAATTALHSIALCVRCAIGSVAMPAGYRIRAGREGSKSRSHPRTRRRRRRPAGRGAAAPESDVGRTGRAPVPRRRQITVEFQNMKK